MCCTLSFSIFDLRCEHWSAGDSPSKFLDREGRDEGEEGLVAMKVKVGRLKLESYTSRLPSRDYAKQHLDEMARSLKQLGQLNPILVKRQLQEIELEMFKAYDYEASGVCPACGKRVKLQKPKITVNAWRQDIINALRKFLEELQLSHLDGANDGPHR